MYQSIPCEFKLRNYHTEQGKLIKAAQLGELAQKSNKGTPWGFRWEKPKLASPQKVQRRGFKDIQKDTFKGTKGH